MRKACVQLMVIAAAVLFLTMAAGIAVAADEQNLAEVVQASTMDGYPNATVGQAFHEKFDGPRWLYFQAENGAHIVDFSGRISQRLHDSAVAAMREQYNADQLHQISAATIDFNQFKGDRSNPDQVVQFFMDTEWWPVGSEVNVQWLLDLEKGSFGIHGVFANELGGLPNETIMEIIYR